MATADEWVGRSVFPLLPDADALLALEPEELAGVILEHIHRAHPNERPALLNRQNYSLRGTVEGYPEILHSKLLSALMEAWSWLEREGMVAPRPGQNSSWVFVTRRGERIRRRAELDAYRRSEAFPRDWLHPVIRQRVWSAFLRGEYDVAVLQALKEVEVAVREAGGFSAEELGTKLMQAAFQPNSGPLADHAAPQGEQAALMELFKAAIGSYRNPHAHRHVPLTDPAEAAEIVGFASHLMRVVDRRRPGGVDTQPDQ